MLSSFDRSSLIFFLLWGHLTFRDVQNFTLLNPSLPQTRMMKSYSLGLWTKSSDLSIQLDESSSTVLSHVCFGSLVFYKQMRSQILGSILNLDIEHSWDYLVSTKRGRPTGYNRKAPTSKEHQIPRMQPTLFENKPGKSRYFSSQVNVTRKESERFEYFELLRAQLVRISQNIGTLLS